MISPAKAIEFLRDASAHRIMECHKGGLGSISESTRTKFCSSMALPPVIVDRNGDTMLDCEGTINTSLQHYRLGRNDKAGTALRSRDKVSEGIFCELCRLVSLAVTICAFSSPHTDQIQRSHLRTASTSSRSKQANNMDGHVFRSSHGA